MSPNICFAFEELSTRTMLLHLTSYSPYRYQIVLWPKRTSVICQLGDLIIVVTDVYCREVEESHEPRSFSFMITCLLTFTAQISLFCKVYEGSNSIIPLQGYLILCVLSRTSNLYSLNNGSRGRPASSKIPRNYHHDSAHFSNSALPPSPQLNRCQYNCNSSKSHTTADG